MQVCKCASVRVRPRGTLSDESSVTGVGDEISNYHTLILFFPVHTPLCGAERRIRKGQGWSEKEEEKKRRSYTPPHACMG